MTDLSSVQTLRSLKPVLTLDVPWWNPLGHSGGIRVATDSIRVTVVIWPELADLGVVRRLHGYSITETFIVLREMDRQVLLHELLHVILDGVMPAAAADHHNHAVIGALEVGLSPFLSLADETAA